MPRRNVERKGGVVELEHWMEAAGLSEYLPALIAERVTFDDIASLTTDDLRELGLPLGPRRRFLTAAARLDRDEPSDPYATPDAERRVMTVVFFDLVGSTALSEQLDPEEMRNLLAAYQDLVTEVVTRHGGYLAKYLGDGTLAYFGWPRATEDQTVRSVRAALDVVGVVPSLPVPHTEDPLAGRVGIATGQVVVGDVSGERGAIVGRTANLAARLEGEAESGGVVIDAATAELVRGVPQRPRADSSRGTPRRDRRHSWAVTPSSHSCMRRGRTRPTDEEVSF